MKRINQTLFASALALTASLSLAADTVDSIIAKSNLASYYSGNDGKSQVRMMVVDAQGNIQKRQFVILRKDVEDAGDQRFLVVFERPSDWKNTVFRVEKHTKGDDDRWLYLPGLDLVKRIASGDKRTSFVGSHFFYEDVSGRNPSEDTYNLRTQSDTQWVIDAVPNDPQSVEFARYEIRIDKATHLPVNIDYYNAAGKKYRSVQAQKIENVQGFPTVVESKVSDLSSGGYTLMQFRNMQYDLGLPDDVFSERSLKRPPSEHLK